MGVVCMGVCANGLRVCKCVSAHVCGCACCVCACEWALCVHTHVCACFRVLYVGVCTGYCVHVCARVWMCLWTHSSN